MTLVWCEYCQGSGVAYRDRWRNDYINGGYIEEVETICSHCEGDGTVIVSEGEDES